MKWLPVVLVVALAVVFVVWQRGATKTAYVNGLPAYSELPGREYILERDCYIFADSNKRSDFPLIADSALVPTLPAKIDRALVGTKIGTLTLLEIVPIGTRFRLASVRRDESPKATSITFELQFVEQEGRKYTRIDAYCLLDHTPEARGAAPVFLERYMVDRVRN